MNNTSNVVTNIYKPIQVKRVSQLELLSIKLDEKSNKPIGYYNELCEDNTLKENDIDINNAYIMVGYPTSEEMPHNFKFSLANIINFCYLSTSVVDNLFSYVNKKCDYLMQYVTYLIQTNGTENIPPNVDAGISYINTYWNIIKTDANLEDLYKIWNKINE